MLHIKNNWDKLLKIKTSGRDDSNADLFRYPYEPTPYSVLERLANSDYLDKNSVVVDYGCGKGRVDFFLAYQVKCRTIGVEFDERIFSKAKDNLERCVSANKVSFVNKSAENYDIPEDVNACYFFNPFSVEILKKVISRILESYFVNPRKIHLIFYYPSNEYIGYLMTMNNILFVDEIDCRDLFIGNNEREKMIIFEIG